MTGALVCIVKTFRVKSVNHASLRPARVPKLQRVNQCQRRASWSHALAEATGHFE